MGIFGSFKKGLNKTVVIAGLNKFQEEQKALGMAGAPLSEMEFKLVIEMPLFAQVCDNHKKHGLNNWGALAWLSHEMISDVMAIIEKEGKASEIEREICIKICSMAVVSG